jgi:hypothetical protein
MIEYVCKRKRNVALVQYGVHKEECSKEGSKLGVKRVGVSWQDVIKAEDTPGNAFSSSGTSSFTQRTRVTGWIGGGLERVSRVLTLGKGIFAEEWGKASAGGSIGPSC